MVGLKYFATTICIMVALSCAQKNPESMAQVDTTKPWSYWWWMGSSVTKEGISANLKAYQQAGFGGMHIIPIYGEKGDEENYIDFLSPRWMDMLVHTVSEAEKLGMGIDMTMGTGWPFGGPDISLEHAAKTFEIQEWNVAEFSKVQEIIKGKGKLIALTALRENGSIENITNTIQQDGSLSVTEKNIYEKMYALIMYPTVQKVKRAAPGGEGLVLDYFNRSAMDTYFQRFKKAFDETNFSSPGVRAFYNDSYEVYGANFTTDFLEEFHRKRGYNLVHHLSTLADTTRTEIRDRIISDFCETISDLLQTEFTENWVNKSRSLGMLTRNQAHGSPGNILDLYGAADIPETESFGVSSFSIPGLRQDPDFEEAQFGRPNPLAMKFASSSAHLLNKKLVSSETATWLGDHFKVALSQIKPQIDELFIAGINHVFYHGITYSPPEKPFPGRLFYASTNFGPHAHFWDELPALNQYVMRCQRILQQAKPDNDLLIYFPIHDLYANKSTDQIIRLLTAHHTRDWLEATAFGEVVTDLWNDGFTFDYISDRMLDEARVLDSQIHMTGGTYKTLIVPKCHYIPEQTMHKLLELSRSGVKIIFSESLPATVNGLYQLKTRQAKLSEMKAQAGPNIIVSKDVVASLKDMGIRNEEMSSRGLSFIRKKQKDDIVYFVSNLSNRFKKGTISLAIRATHVEIFDPLTGEKGLAKSRIRGEQTEILLPLAPGQSSILRCSNTMATSKQWTYFEEQEEDAFPLATQWTLTPNSDASTIPKPVVIDSLLSWTTFGEDYEVYSGKMKYTAEFTLDQHDQGKAFSIKFEDVRETASLSINGQDLGLLWSVPYVTMIPKGLLKKQNEISIEVTNLSFNRIIDMDRKGIPWKNFHDINLVNIKYEPFDASRESAIESGLIGDVWLIPLVEMD